MRGGRSGVTRFPTATVVKIIIIQRIADIELYSPIHFVVHDLTRMPYPKIEVLLGWAEKWLSHIGDRYFIEALR